MRSVSALISSTVSPGSVTAVNTHTLDRDLYRAWWEAEGRGNLSVCPCGVPADRVVPEERPVRMPPGHGLCPRHRFDLSGVDRETFAHWVIDGTFIERDA
jgi:hypothetical protein